MDELGLYWFILIKDRLRNQVFCYLLQGNLKFSVDGDTPVIENGKVVSIIADLLSTKSDMVEKALLFRTVATGRDVIDKQHTEQEATYGRDAFAKVSLNFLSLHLILYVTVTQMHFFCLLVELYLVQQRMVMPEEGIQY